MVLFLHDLSRVGQADYEAEDERIRARLAGVEAHRIVQVFNKTDLGTPPTGEIALSLKTGEGLAALRQRLLQTAGWQAVPEGLFIARERHVQALARTAEHLALARTIAEQRDAALDLLAEELRLAHDALGEITGAFSADELLGVIFSSFCIGK